MTQPDWMQEEQDYELRKSYEGEYPRTEHGLDEVVNELLPHCKCGRLFPHDSRVGK